jgi:hypothetical protein
MEMFNELIHNMTLSTAAGTVGVCGIWIYMAIIVSSATYRIIKGEHMHH